MACGEAGSKPTSESIHRRYAAWHTEQLSKQHVCGSGRKAAVWYPLAGIGDASARLAVAYRHALLGGWLFFVDWLVGLSLAFTNFFFQTV